MDYKYYWCGENGAPMKDGYDDLTFPSEAAARTWAEATGQTCCDGVHEWNLLATAWEEMYSECLKCYLYREVS